MGNLIALAIPDTLQIELRLHGNPVHRRIAEQGGETQRHFSRYASLMRAQSPRAASTDRWIGIAVANAKRQPQPNDQIRSA